jgi:uncharacterized protein
MTPRLLLLLAPLAVQCLIGPPASAAQPVPDPAGYWEGSVHLPSDELAIKVDLAKGTDGKWSGTIEIPRQGFRGFTLNPVTVYGSNVAFTLPGVPGEPRFAGTLTPDGKTIKGEFTQGPAKLSFTLGRATRPAKVGADEAPAAGIPGKGLAGNWRGSIKPMPGIELRLALELTQTPAGKLDGTAISLDQDNARVPITTLTQAGDKVHFELASVGALFDGKLNANQSEIAGDWSQTGRTTPLVFMRTAPATGPGARK